MTVRVKNILPKSKHANLLALGFVLLFVVVGIKLLSFSSHAETPSSVITYQSACNSAPVGYAACLALDRTDPAATQVKPLKPEARSLGQPEVLPGSCGTGALVIGDCGAYDPSFLQAATI